MTFRTLIAGLATGSLLSGCAAVDALHTATVYDDLNNAGVVTGPAADPAAVAVRTGSAGYTGLGVVAVSDGTTATAFLGDAKINVDFDTADVNGTIVMYRAKGGLSANTDPQSFFNQVEADPTNFLLSMDSSFGTVTLSNGSVAGAGFTAEASSGNLTGGGTTAVITGGTVDAEFTGSTANGVRSTVSSVTGTVNDAAAQEIGLYFAAAE